MSFPLAHLPEDILKCICVFLPVHDLGTLAQVAKRFNRISSDNLIWSNILKRSQYLRCSEDSEEVKLDPVLLDVTDNNYLNKRLWCNPEAIGLTEEILSEMHSALLSAGSDDLSIKFRGETIPLLRQNWNPKTSVIWRRWQFTSLRPGRHQMGGPDSRIIEGRLLAKRGCPEHMHGLAYHKSGSADHMPAAAYYNGSVVRCPLPRLPVTPSPEAAREPGFMKFVFRHAVATFFDVCPFCVRLPTASKWHLAAEGLALRPCEACWLAPDLTLFITPAQALADFGVEESDLRGIAVRHIGNVGICSRMHKRYNWRHNSDDDNEEEKEKKNNDAARKYRIVDVAYLALLKYGSVAAIARRRVAASPQAQAPVPMKTSVRRKRIACDDDDGGEYCPSARQRVKERKKEARKATIGRRYIDDDADALLHNFRTWGTVCY